jgi:CHAD domain-containing protein
VLDALESAGFEVSGPVPTTRIVLDTFDGRLYAAGLRLEAQAGAGTELVLTGPPDAPAARLTWTKAPPAFGADLPPGPFGQRIAGVTQERALLSLLTITSSARTASKRDRRGKVTVSVTLHDRVVVEGAAAAAPSWVAEVVRVVGHDDAQANLETRLASLGLVRHAGDAAAVAAQAADVSLAGRSSSPTISLDRREDALAAYRAVLANLAATVEDNLAGTIADTDPEFLHELRVAVRRSRSVLNQAKGVLPADVRAEYRDVFGNLGAITSSARDLDVYVLGWDDMVAPLQLADPRVLLRVRKEIDRRRSAAHAALSRELSSPGVRAALDRWRAWLADPSVEPVKARPIGPVIARRITKAQDAVLTHGRAITPASPPEALHDLRKDAKKLRYLLECFGGLLPTKPRKAFVSQLKSLQDNLGDHQDAEVQLAELRTLAHDLHARSKVDTDALLAMGRLSDLLDRRRQTERDDFVDRFAAYDTKANRATLAALLAKAADA